MTNRGNHHVDTLSRADHTAHEWVATAAEALGTDDRHHAYQVLRAWLRTVRDRLGVDSAAHFAAQLPLVLRGVYYDGWAPSRVPVKYDAEQFLITVAQEAGCSLDEARHAAPAITAALAQKCSPGQIEHLLAQLPSRLRELLTPVDAAEDPAGSQAPDRPGPASSSSEDPSAPGDPDRLRRIEQRLDALVEALRMLVRGMENHPSDEPQPERLAAAVHRTHRALQSLDAT